MTVTTSENPIGLFKDWLADAERSEPNNPNAMTLATVTPDGAASARMILLKGVDERGFTFYTNLGSRKAEQLSANPRAALCFYWKSLKRQVHVEGTVERVDDAEADAYFATRPRGAQIGAWASKQSRPMEGRFRLEARVAKYTAKFHVGTVPRPDFWSGFRVVPEHIEFWREQPFRLHDRVVYHRDGGGWRKERLYP
ncbi:MAG: pyridoxamine 5'-phosphate oxidase [Proteobacteria bacterium]|nr:pyridoxamine 5'-phosphate oxidase [Pseudomonadota bacterium]